MSIKKHSANQLTDDIVQALEMEEENLSADICRKLRQNRYKAIDHAAIIDKRDYFSNAAGWAVASIAAVIATVMLSNSSGLINAFGATKLKLAQFTTTPAVDPGTAAKKEINPENIGPTTPSTNDENQQKNDAEDLEIYEWLYNNYG